MDRREGTKNLHDNTRNSKKIFLVGSPNVGKSALFNALTGSYVTVSNYPGTTVDVSSGKIKIGGHHLYNVIDTPGMYSLRPITAEEDVTRKLIIHEKPDCVLHVVDSKNLERMLPLTFQFIETGLPVILVLNLYDELLARGMQLHIAHLEHDLGIPVVETVAVKGIGIDNLISRIVEVIENRYRFNTIERYYSPEIEDRLSMICELLQNDYSLSKRSIATLVLLNDPDILDMVTQEKCYEAIKNVLTNIPQNIANRISQERQAMAHDIVVEHLVLDEQKRRGAWKEKLSQIMVHPVWGIPILAIVLWFGLYKFVGEFGAGTMVDFIETNIFENLINPKVASLFHAIFGSSIFFDLFAGEYGVITLGVRYAIAIIFPVLCLK